MSDKPFLTLHDVEDFELGGVYVSSSSDATLEWLGVGELATDTGPMPVLVFREVSTGSIYLSYERDYLVGETFEPFADRAFDDLDE